MFDSKPITINVPPGPYPDCGNLDIRGVQCHGTLVPKVEPARCVVPRDVIAAPGACPIDREAWMEGSVVLYWQCNRCGKRV